jgi:hypothetical protein
MNVFILCTGRCGSTTFIEAAKHISNYTAAHESRARLIGPERFDYPLRHIEADNRLSWLLGRLDQAFGDTAFYVHMKRDDAATAESLFRRSHSGMMRAYAAGVLMRKGANHSPLDVCLDYCDTVNSNIVAFLKDKSRTMTFSLENAKGDFRRFWTLIGAEGDLNQALAAWDVRHNASADSIVRGAARKTLDAVRRLPGWRRSA